MANSTPSMQDLLEAGVHFGHQVRRGNPRMKPYIFGARDGVHIIDLEKSEQMLKEATKAAYDMGKQGKILLIIGTKKQAKSIVEDLAKEVDTPYINSHWIGGLLTNFDEIRRNIKKLNDLKQEQDKGELSRYTKKEQLLISKKLKKYEVELGGIKDLDKLPDAVFIIDAVAEATAVKEAQRMGVTSLGFADTNSDPSMMDYPVAANDDGIKAIKIVAETVIHSYGQGKKDGGINISQRSKDENQKETKPGEEKLDEPVAKEAEVIEQMVEDEIVDENSGKAKVNG